MRLPTLAGTIKRRILVNFSADPARVQAILPAPFKPKLHEGHAVVGVCLIRLEHIRPNGLPDILGFSSENAAHRIAIQWTENGVQREGVFIPRRDTGSKLNQLVGGRIFPGEHNHANFTVEDDGARIKFQMQSADRAVEVRLTGRDAPELPATSIFKNLAQASAFFEGGSLGYSVTRDPNRLDALQLETLQWRVSALQVDTAYSSWFADEKRFPKDAIQFDHALIMRDIPHRWHSVD
jgi:hypothetical protein